MKKHLISLVVGLLTLTACTSENVVDESPQSYAIGFENVVNKNTRAGIEGDLTSKTFDTFLVYGYYTKEQMSTPIQIFNGVQVLKGVNSATGKEEWTYDGVRYWIPKCTYYFYAYSCGDVALSTGKGSPAMTLTNETTVDGRALAIMSYRCDGTHQHDLVAAESEGIMALESQNPQVSLSFRHALCKIKAIFTTDFPKGYQIKISNVKISEYYNFADYNVGTNIWSDFKAVDAPFTILNVDENDNILISDNNNSVETSEAFLIPKQYSNTENVKIHFTIEVTKDGEVILERNITGTWSPKWEPSSMYKYNINITGSSAGIEPIVFAASQTLGSSTWGASTEVNMVFGVDTGDK